MVPFQYRPMTAPGKIRREALITQLAEELTDDELDELEVVLARHKATPKPVAKRRGPPKIDLTQRAAKLVAPVISKPVRAIPRISLSGKTTAVPIVKSKVIAPVVRAPKPALPVGLPQGMPPHLIIDALAGSGKTTVLEEGVRRIFGRPPKFIGSEQQEAIWASMVRGPKPKTVCVVSCMNSIVDELEGRLIAPAYASTCHKFGRSLIYKNIGSKKPEVDDDNNKVRNLLAQHMDMTLHTIYRRMPRFVKSVCDFVKFCKIGLLDLDLIDDKGVIEDHILRLMDTYDIDCKDEYLPLVIDIVPVLLKACFEQKELIDFDDMLWFPHRLKINSKPIDLLMVDERQDLNHAQQEMLLKNAKRLIVVGDTHQAVMGFAGGDFEACEHMNEKLLAARNGAEIYPLTYTRRCSRTVTELAQTLVPEIECLPDAIEGVVRREAESVWSYKLLDMQDGDMVICRVNAPLIQYAMRLFKEKRQVRIQGRNIGEDIINRIKGFKAVDLYDLRLQVDDWYKTSKAKFDARPGISESIRIALEDDYAGLVALITESKTITEVIETVRSLFSDTKGKGILLASIHRAKGLEPPTGRTVYFLRYNLLPHPMARSLRARKQELNLQYVGITRAKGELVLIHDDVSKTQGKNRKEFYDADTEGD